MLNVFDVGYGVSVILPDIGLLSVIDYYNRVFLNSKPYTFTACIFVYCCFVQRHINRTFWLELSSYETWVTSALTNGWFGLFFISHC